MLLLTRILLVYFSLGAFFPKGDFSQLLHLDDLIEHYTEHKEEALIIGETISFNKYLYLHFVGGENHSHDENDHEDLPFQSFSSSITFYFSSDLQNATNSVENKSVSLPLYNSIIEDEISFDIFHPPMVS